MRQAPNAHTNCEICQVREQSICSALQGPDLDAFATITHTKNVLAGETIITEGDPASHFYNLVSGAIRLVKLLPNGRRQILGFLYPGDFVGLASSEAYSYSAETLSNSQLCQFDIKSFKSFALDHPDMTAALLKRANQELTVALDQMLLLGRKTPIERLASFLLRLPTDCGHVKLVMTRQDIADYLGLTIETVSRNFSKLKSKKLIGLPARSVVTILDPEGLRACADEI